MILITVLREIRNLKDPNPTKLKYFKYVLSMKGRCKVYVLFFFFLVFDHDCLSKICPC